MEKYLRIGEVAEKIGVNPQTLRRWDKSGKFPSKRHPINNYRVYTNEQVQHLLRELELEYSTERREIRIVKAPCFQTELGRLYNIDAIEFLKGLPTQSVHLIFADPPYNIKKAEWDTFESQREYIRWSMEWIIEAHRVLHATGSLYVCGFSEILADIKWSTAGLFAGCKWLVWYYRNKANLGNDWGRSHESLLHLRKTRKFIFNIDEARIPYNAHTLRYPTHPQAASSQYSNGRKEHVWSPHPKGAKPKDVFEIPTLSNHSWEKTPHPTQKPLELVKKLVLTSSDQDSLIVDPFGGSGTTYVAAEALGRKWLGSELDSNYCEIIRNRLCDGEQLARTLTGKDETEARERRRKLRR